MKKEYFTIEEIIRAVLHGADDVAVWYTGNHSIGHYEQGLWVSDDLTDLEELSLVHSILALATNRFRLSLSKRQEVNFWKIVNWLREDEVEIRFS